MGSAPRIPRKRRWLTSANVLATVALIVSLTGTTYAATMVSGARFKNNSLTGKDIKHRTLFATKWTSAALSYLHSRQGPDGPRGVTGTPGPQGIQGQGGLKGQPAPRAFSYITADDNHTLIKNPLWSNPGTAPACNVAYAGTCATTVYPDWTYDCGSGNHYCQISGSFTGSPVRVLNSWTPVMRFVSGTNGGYLTLDKNGNVILTGSATVWHLKADQFSRIACKVEIRSSAQNANFVDVGIPVQVSSSTGDGLIVLTAVGGIHLTPGDYDFQMSCRQLDESNILDPSNDWWFVKGNVNAVSTEY